MIEIFSKNGTKLAKGSKHQYNGNFMEVSYVTMNIDSPKPIDFEIGDYITYRGERYELNYTPAKVKNSSSGSTGNAFSYKDLKFDSLANELINCQFLDYVDNDNTVHISTLSVFSFFASTVKELADRIQANMDRIYTGGQKWTISAESSAVSTVDLSIKVDGINCMQALQLANSKFKLNYIIRDRHVTIGTAGLSIDRILGYGKDNGLFKLEQSTSNNAMIVTRLRVYGSTKNMPYDYYSKLPGSIVPESAAVPNLMLPGFENTWVDTYLDSPNISKYGIREGYVYFDGRDDSRPEIFPTFGNFDGKNTISSAEQLVDDGKPPVEGSGNKIPSTFEMSIPDIGFDINDYSIAGTAPQISMLSGRCNTRSFDIEKCVWKEGGYALTLKRTPDPDSGVYYPNALNNILAGDTFTLLNIIMPDIYIQEAAQKLLTHGRQYLSEVDHSKYIYTPKIDNVYMARNPELHDTLKEGDIINFRDEDLGVDASVIIQSLTIKEGGIIPEYEITLFNDKVSSSRLDKIQNSINSLANNIGITIEQAKSIFRMMINAWYPDWFDQPLHTYDPVRFARVIAEEFTENEIVPDTPVDPENPDTPTPALLSLTGDEPTCTTFTEIGQGDEPQPVVTTIGALSNVSDNADIAANGSILVAENGEYVPKLAGSIPELQGPPGPAGGSGPAGPAGPSGQDGHSPVITVGADTDGKLYWKIDGEWLLYNGEKVPAAGSTEPPVTSLGSLTNVEGTVDDAVTDDVVLYRETDSEVWKKKAVKDIFVQTGLQRNVRVVNNLDSKSIAASKGEPCILDFTFISQERYSSNDPYENTGERGLCMISVKNSSNADFVVVKQIWIDSSVSVKVDVAEYLTSGSNQVMVKVTGEITETTTPAFVYTVQLTSLSISANNFRWWTAYLNDITLPLNIGGNVAKTLYVKVSGTGYNESYEIPIGTSIYVETAYNYVIKHPGRTGVFQIECYVASSDGGLRTRTLYFNIICAVSGDTTKLIAINNVIDKARNWSENRLFDYTMYEGDNTTTSAQFVVKKDGETVFSSDEATIPTSSKQTFSFPMEIETIDNSAFDIVVSVMSGSESLTNDVVIPVDNSAGYSAVAGAVFYMNPRTRTNRQENYMYVVNEMNKSTVSVDWANMNWENDGWTTGNDGGRVLRVMAGSRAVINYRPFEKESARTGKTIEIDYRVDNVTDDTIPVFDISSGAGDSFVGLKIMPDNVVMHSQALKNTDVQSFYTDTAKRIRLTLVIMPDAYGNPGFNLCLIYINGKKNREFSYENNDYFAQSGAITIGSDYADIDIYGIRVYDSALTFVSVLRNYINWLSDNTMKEKIQNDNDVLDANGSEIDFNNTRDQYNVMVFDNTIPRILNPSKRVGTLDVSLFDHPERNADITHIEAKGQGTSSMRYYLWNTRYSIDKTLSVITHADGTTSTKKWQMVEGIPAAAKFTAKKNYASSMQSHKMGSVNSVQDLFKKMGFTNEAMETEKYADTRIAVYQLPFICFEKSVNDLGEEVYTFAGEYTFGPDKGDKYTFGYDTDMFPGLISIEGSDNSPLATLFRVPWNEKMVYNPDEEAFQYNGANAWDFDGGLETNIDKWIPAYNLVYSCSNRLKPFNGTLDELQSQASTLRTEPNEFWIARDGDPNRYNVYYYEASEARFVGSDIGQGQINLVQQLVDKGYGLSASHLEGKTIDQLNELFINARVQKFRQEAPEYWDINDAIFHRNWVEMHAGTDNRAKNTYPYNFGTPTSKWKWRYDDMDTIFDTDNEGQPDKSYSVEFHDKTSTGASVWNGETSNFWNLLDLAFPGEIVTEMRRMFVAAEELGGLKSGNDYDKLFAYYKKYYFEAAQEYFPANIVNQDAKIAYEYAKIAYNNGTYTNDTDPITQSLGDHYLAEQRWVSKRILYMMSKYSFGIFSADGTDSITVRAAGNTITYDLTPAMDLYPAIANGTSIIRGERTMAGQVCRMVIELSGSGDQQNTIQGASYLQDIGDWHEKNVSGAMIIQGRMLREIRLGSKTEPVLISISALTITNCVSLQRLVLSNIATLAGTINLGSCTHLQEVYADGTKLSQIKLPSGGGLRKIEFSAYNQYLQLSNYPLLTNAGVGIELCKEIITDFFIVNCIAMQPIRLLVDIMNAQADQGTEHVLKRIRAVGFEETYNTSEMLDKLAELADGSYSGLNSEGLAGEDEYPVLDGTLTVYASAYEDSVEALRNTFRKLTLNVIGEFYVRFRDKVVQDICVSLWGDGFGVTRSELASVTNLSDTAFKGNTEIRSFDELEYLTGISVIPMRTFKGCSSLKSAVIPVNVNNIETASFYNSGLDSIIIPKNVTNIGGSCFYKSKLKSVFFEERTKILYIYDATFRECRNLVDVFLPDTTRYNPGQNRESEYNFRDCTSLTSVHLPVSPEVTYIPMGMFWGCESLVDFNISPYITRIRTNAFNGCHLSKIDLSQTNVEILDEGAFANNKSPNIIFNNKITSIGKSCFAYCEFETFEFPEKVTVIPPEVLRLNKPLRHVILPSGVTEIGTWAFAGNTIEDFVCMAPIPPSITDNIFAYGIFPAIYVPDASVEAYKTAAGWSAYASRIYPLSEKPQQ